MLRQKRQKEGDDQPMTYRKKTDFLKDNLTCVVLSARALLGFMTIVGTGKGGTEEAQKDSPLRCIVVLGRGSDAIFRILSTAGRCEATLGLFFTT